MVAKCKCPSCGKEAEYIEEKWICGCGWGKEMSFGEAIVKLKAGKKMSRRGWNGKNMFIYICHSLLPYAGATYPSSEFIVMKTADEKLIPWLASQTDMLAEDWGIVG